jgi:N-acetylneuraminic acid mutarotase
MCKDFFFFFPDNNFCTQIADFPEPRDNAVGFSIGNKGYIGTGHGDAYYSLKKDFWEYDPNDNRWTRKADFGGSVRSIAVGFSIENKGYIGTGLYEDVWEYDPINNGWTKKADFPGELRAYAVGFAIANKGYIGTGGYSNLPEMQDFWEFKP